MISRFYVGFEIELPLVADPFETNFAPHCNALILGFEAFLNCTFLVFFTDFCPLWHVQTRLDHAVNRSPRKVSKPQIDSK